MIKRLFAVRFSFRSELSSIEYLEQAEESRNSKLKIRVGKPSVDSSRVAFHLGNGELARYI